MDLSAQTSVFVMGQHLTSRTEAVYEYFRTRASDVSVFAIYSHVLTTADNHFFEFRRGRETFHRVYGHSAWLLRPSLSGFLLPAHYLVYFFDLVRIFLRHRRRYDVFLGISPFSGAIGVVLKKMGLAKTVVFYAIDHTPYSRGMGILQRLSRWWYTCMDRIAVRYSDEVWNISNKIVEVRNGMSVRHERYRHKSHIVPLGYAPSFFRQRPLNEVRRFSAVFVGIINRNHGFDLLFKILPDLIRVMPSFTVEIVGGGQHLDWLKSRVAKLDHAEHVRVHGFIGDVSEMLDIVSRCGVGISIWDTTVEIPYSAYGDPGKTKMYTVCGLPVVVGNITEYSETIRAEKAGVAINYDARELKGAIIEILLDDAKYLAYRAAARETALKYCSSEEILGKVVHIRPTESLAS